MAVTITLKDLGLIILFIAIIALIIYLIVALKNLISVLKKTDSILEDVNDISALASSRVAQVDELVDNATAKIATAMCSVINNIRKDKSGDIVDSEDQQ